MSFERRLQCQEETEQGHQERARELEWDVAERIARVEVEWEETKQVQGHLDSASVRSAASAHRMVWEPLATRWRVRSVGQRWLVNNGKPDSR